MYALLEVRFATQAVTATVPNNIRMIWAIDRQANAHLPAIGPNDLLRLLQWYPLGG